MATSSGKSVLIVDDLAIYREPLAMALQLAGFSTLHAADANEALGVMETHDVDLVLLDLMLPDIDGLSMLRAVRTRPEFDHIQFIVLTGAARREAVVRAKALGAKEYLVKSAFSLEELIDRVRFHLGLSLGSPSHLRLKTMFNRNASSTTALSPSPTTTAPAVNRQSTPRLDELLQPRVLPGSTQRILELIKSPDGDPRRLSDTIAADPLLAARVIQLANSAAYSNTKGGSTSIDEAVLKLGFQTIGSLAATLGFYDCISGASKQSWFIRYLEHSLAVASIMECMIPDTEQHTRGAAYLIGLCHDLTTILLRKEIPALAAPLNDRDHDSDEALYQEAEKLFGMPRGQLVTAVLSHLKLGPSIVEPIREHVETSWHQEHGMSRSAHALRLAHYLANGMLLAPNAGSFLRPIFDLEFRRAIGVRVPASLNGASLRRSVRETAITLTKIPQSRLAQLCPALKPQQPAKIAYWRSSSCLLCDPIIEALQAMSQVVQLDGHVSADTIPTDCKAAVLVIDPICSESLTILDLFRQVTTRRPFEVLCFTPSNSLPEQIATEDWLRLSPNPTSIQDLSAFLTN